MSLSEIPLFRMMSQRMEWLSQRQQIIATNVANANTPGYKAQDLNSLSFDKMLRAGTGKLNARVIRSGHLTGISASGSDKFKLKPKEDDKAQSMTGNDVLLEQEMMKVAQTAMD